MKNGKKIFSFLEYVMGRKESVHRSLAVLKPTERARDRTEGGKCRRKSSFLYFLPVNDLKGRVCQTMFLLTLSISEKIIINWKIKDKDEHEQDEDVDEQG